MIKKTKRTQKEIRAEKRRLDDVLRRFLNPNIEARKFCWKNSFTVYAAAQRNNKVKVFKQFGEKFKPVSHIEYDQYEESEVMEYHAVIDIEYEKMWKLKKDSNNAE
jgi:hypothetical protein